jgi:formate hydrogenlyase subunit 6/NADH:ubiquinone oxidoreductase subunit I
MQIIDRNNLDALFAVLPQHGYGTIFGPTVRDGAIVLGKLSSSRDLPAGWTDEQENGRYRLKKRADEALFGYAVGPHSWKKLLHPPTVRMWQARRVGDGFQIPEAQERATKLAFIGVRPCELHAMAIQDQVFMNGAYVDHLYKSRRENVFIVAVNCGHAGGTCFCVSMNTGPKARQGFDLALTEILERDRHYFVVETGTDLGAEILREIPHRQADDEQKAKAEQVVANAAGQMGRSLDTNGIQNLLYTSAAHPHWDEVAGRCLSCANCTMVCPTCFCTTVEDVTDLTGAYAERWRRWDSCFTMDFSYIHGGSVRPSVRARYRQWLTHKLASWIDQFGVSGCVGCGRCLTWCPVGIDITEEVRALRGNEKERNDGNA